jgi:rhomboid-like protein
MFQSTEIVKKLFYINVIAFILTLVLQNLFGVPVLDYLALFPLLSPNFHIYQPVTHLFMHGGIMHILFNMLALLSFGPEVENQLGQRKFLLFYFIMGFGAAALQMIMSNGAMIGASGAIFGLLTYFTVLNPDTMLSIFFLPISFKAKNIFFVLIGIEIISALFFYDGVGHWAHLGGALTGYILYKLDYKYQFNV